MIEPLQDAQYCTACGTPAAATAKFCGDCGASLRVIAPTAPPTRPAWYYNIWLILLMLFFVLGPFGLPLVWKHPTLSKRAKSVLTWATIGYTVIGLVILIWGGTTVYNLMMERVKQLDLLTW